jgi:hypothetical protein
MTAHSSERANDSVDGRTKPYTESRGESGGAIHELALPAAMRPRGTAGRRSRSAFAAARPTQLLPRRPSRSAIPANRMSTFCQ